MIFSKLCLLNLTVHKAGIPMPGITASGSTSLPLLFPLSVSLSLKHSYPGYSHHVGYPQSTILAFSYDESQRNHIH